MRIAYVCADPGVPVFGCKGSSIHVQEVVSALTRIGATVKLLASTIGGETPMGLEHVEVHKLPKFSGDQDISVFSANDALRDKLEQTGPFDLVYERYSLWSFAAMEYTRSLGIPGLLEVNSPLIEEQVRYRHLLDPILAERVADRAFRAANVLIAVSDGVATYLTRYPHLREKVNVVPNGVNPKRFPDDLKASRPAAPRIFTVGFVGSLKPWHGLPILVKAFSDLHRKAPNTRLLIVGDGPERSELVKELVEENLLDSTEITGAVAPSEVPGLLASMDVAVAPYPKLEHFYFSPLKVYEYMAAGLPVVASSLGQLTELIHDDVNGMLIPAGDHRALAIALDRLRRDPRLGKRLGHAARETVLRKHSWDSVVSRILELGGFGKAQKASLRGELRN